MARVERIIPAPPEQVFAVLADGWTYSDWVVGTAHIRDVEAGWPAVGTRIHHKAGPWPVSIHDRSVSLECDPPRMLLLKVRIWPLGAALVRFELTPTNDGGTRIAMTEDFAEGPLQWVHTKVNDLVLHQRNVEALRRLSDFAVRRAQHGVEALER
ncbi:MAG TPA: SRPBCC family protein [Micromonosporaceae bacterium]|nr:SRPBCC family protein [Micromonosporaceae bacterium]